MLWLIKKRYILDVSAVCSRNVEISCKKTAYVCKCERKCLRVCHPSCQIKRSTCLAFLRVFDFNIILTQKPDWPAERFYMKERETQKDDGPLFQRKTHTKALSEQHQICERVLSALKQMLVRHDCVEIVWHSFIQINSHQLSLSPRANPYMQLSLTHIQTLKAVGPVNNCYYSDGSVIVDY